MSELQKAAFQAKVYIELSQLNKYLLYNHIFNPLKFLVQHTLVFHIFGTNKFPKDCNNLQDQNHLNKFNLNFYIIYYLANKLFYFYFNISMYNFIFMNVF